MWLSVQFGMAFPAQGLQIFRIICKAFHGENVVSPHETDRVMHVGCGGCDAEGKASLAEWMLH